MKKILLTISTIIAFVFGTTAQNVNIPDANFKAYLVGDTLINTNGDTEIQLNEANGFAGTIYANGLSIDDLTGIEEFTALTALECQDNLLTTLNLSTNTNLIYLKCYSNYLTELDLSTNTALTTLNCSSNFLTNLDLSTNTSLTNIKCQVNHLTNLNIANGNNLNITNFDARVNSLTCINVDNPASNMSNYSTYIDQGAYFNTNCSGTLFAEIVYVDINATGNHDGTSWTDAYSDLLSATRAANHLSQIWVVAGTYSPSPTAREYSFNPVAEMYGGFNGTETQLSQRDWKANPTILSGDIGTVGDETDNTYTILAPRASDSIVIDGFTISDGYSDHTTAINRYGAGIYIINGVTPITIKDCIIKNNSATAGTGIYCRMEIPSKTKNITIENTRITQNKARWKAAFDIQVVDGTMNANLINCLVDSNQTLTMFNGNGSTYAGGGFLEYEAGNNAFISNPKLNGKIINCTFVGNVDLGPPTPRALIATQGPTLDLEIYNTILWNSTGTLASVSYGTASQYEPNSVTVYNTISIDVMNTASYITSTNNTQVNPLFTNPTIMDYTLQNGSPAINGGSTSGIAAFIPATDLAGDVRLNGLIDLGCYEDQTGLAINELTSQNNYSIYPNPVGNILNIELGTTPYTYFIQIISSTGQILQSHQSNSNTNQIDVSQLPTGIYFVQLIDKNKQFITRKFIKE